MGGKRRSLIVAALWIPLAAGAQQAPEATFYETATVRERPLSSATGSVTVLDRAAIEASGARTVGELLRFAPGVDVTSGGGRGGLTTAQIRGGDPNFTLILLDGVPVNDPTYPVGGVFNLEGLSAFAVERIEIVRGPLSSFYGSTGLAGAIHIITREGESGAPRVSAEAWAGDASLRTLSGVVSGGRKGASWLVGGTWEEEAGRIAEESFRGLNVHGNLSADLSPRARLELKTRAASWDADDYPDASGGPVYGSGELRRADNREASLGAELHLGAPERRRHRLTASVYRHALDRTSPAVAPLVPPSAEETVFTTARLGWISTLWSSPGVELSAGADVQRERGVNDSVLFLPPDFGGEVSGSYERTRTLPGAFAEMVWERGGVVVEAGSRFDLPEDRAVQWSPRLGVSRRWGATRVHASAGRAWKLPSFFALASPPALGGNPDLRPEKVLGGDLGVERAFAAAGIEADLTLFYNRYGDLIDFDFATFTHLNRGEVEARGAELAFAWRPRESVALHTSATWQEVEDLAGGARLRHRPKWSGGARLDWRPARRLELRVDLQAVARSFDEQIPVPDRDTVPGYGVFGLGGSYRVTERWRAVGRIDNLTDRDYETLIGFPGPGRSIRLGVAVR